MTVHNMIVIGLGLSVFGVFVSALSIVQQYFKNIVDLQKIKEFKNYETLAEYYFNKAYNIIYKDKIMVYSAEGVSPNEDDIKEIQHIYLELLLQMMGKWIMENLSEYYGDESTVYFNALCYFDEKFENDSLRSSVIEKQISM